MVKKKKKRGFFDPNNVIKLLETQPKDLDRSQQSSGAICLTGKQ